MPITLDALGGISLGLDVAWPAESSWLALRRLSVLNHVTLHQLRAYLKGRAAEQETDPDVSNWTLSGLGQCLGQAQDARVGFRTPTDRHHGLIETPYAQACHWVPEVLARWPCVNSSLRICAPCMTEFGFHSPVYQLAYFKVCPIHGVAFVEQAPCCGRGLYENPCFETYLCRSCAWTGPQAQALQTRPEPPRALMRFFHKYQRFLAKCERHGVTVGRDRDGVADLHPELDYAASTYALEDMQQQAARLFQAFGLRTLRRCAFRLERARIVYFNMRVSPDIPIFKRPKVDMTGWRRDVCLPDDSDELDEYHELLRRGIRRPYGALERLPTPTLSQMAYSRRSKAHTVSGRTGPPWARYVTRDMDVHIRHMLIRRARHCQYLPEVLSTKVPAAVQPRALSGDWCPVCLAFRHWRFAVSSRTGGLYGLTCSFKKNMSLPDRIITETCSPTLVGVGRLGNGMRYQIPVRLRIALLRADLLRLFAGVLMLYWYEWTLKQELWPTAAGRNAPAAQLIPTLGDALYWSIGHYRSYVTVLDDDRSARMLFYNWPHLRRLEGLTYCPGHA